MEAYAPNVVRVTLATSPKKQTPSLGTDLWPSRTRLTGCTPWSRAGRTPTRATAKRVANLRRNLRFLPQSPVFKEVPDDQGMRAQSHGSLLPIIGKLVIDEGLFLYVENEVARCDMSLTKQLKYRSRTRKHEPAVG